MIAAAPRHGYEIMKAIEDQTGGGYSPSPGVIYPTLSWLEDMGYATATAEGGRKSFSVTSEGQAFLAANQATFSELAARLSRPGRRPDVPEPILRAMGNLKQSLRVRFRKGPIDPDTIEGIAAALDKVTDIVETSMNDIDQNTVRHRAEALVHTPKAAGYLAQFCKHFAHKVPVSQNGDSARITFERGDCLLLAQGDILTIVVESGDAEAIPVLEDVVARHLERFAFREELVIDWKHS